MKSSSRRSGALEIHTRNDDVIPGSEQASKEPGDSEAPTTFDLVPSVQAHGKRPASEVDDKDDLRGKRSRSRPSKPL